MRTSVIALAITLAFVIAPRSAECADATAGQAVYLKKCGSCHGKEGEGNPTMEKMLKVTIRPLSEKEIQAKSDDELRKQIVEGVGKMKAVQGLSDDDVKGILAFVRSLAK